VHGWWNIAGAKMSKSLGNAVDPDALADQYGAETLRYYLMSDIALGRDADFSEERLISRYNVELANRVGNLLNRTLSMAQKYRSGVLKKTDGAFDDGVTHANVVAAVKQYAEHFDAHHVDEAIARVISIAEIGNVLIENQKPWALAKDPAQADRLDAVLYHLAESLRIIAILLSPILPKASAGIFAQLNWSGTLSLSEAAWGKLADGHQLAAPTPIFPRLELPAAE
jgi:methionyl-tRNA synthetase